MELLFWSKAVKQVNKQDILQKELVLIQIYTLDNTVVMYNLLTFSTLINNYICPCQEIEFIPTGIIILTFKYYTQESHERTIK